MTSLSDYRAVSECTECERNTQFVGSRDWPYPVCFNRGGIDIAPVAIFGNLKRLGFRPRKVNPPEPRYHGSLPSSRRKETSMGG
jgi:hypothetical protein